MKVVRGLFPVFGRKLKALVGAGDSGSGTDPNQGGHSPSAPSGAPNHLAYFVKRKKRVCKDGRDCLKNC